MLIFKNPHPNDPPVLLPPSLLEWFSAKEMALFAIQATQNVVTPAPLWRGQEKRFTTRMLLSLLGYCYATALFDSREIEARINIDRTLRYLCAGQLPNWEDLRQFRRRNLHAVRLTVTELLKAAWTRRRFDESGGDFQDAICMSAIPVGVEREIQLEADRRIRWAMQADSMALDE